MTFTFVLGVLRCLSALFDVSSRSGWWVLGSILLLVFGVFD